MAAAPALGAPAPVEHRYRTMEVPDDPYYGTQWSLPTIGAVRAWDVTTGGAPGVRIAVIDSGVEAGHPDLAPNITGANPGETGNGREDNGIDDDGNGKVDDWRGWDFVGNDNNPLDTTPERHGTHVAGVIAARGDNGLGMAGVAWRAQVIPIRAIGSDGTGSESAIAGAIRYASERGARIVNASFGGDEFSAVHLQRHRRRPGLAVRGGGRQRRERRTGRRQRHDAGLPLQPAAAEHPLRDRHRPGGPAGLLRQPGRHVGRSGRAGR